jgi:hypothetical protein
VELALGYFVEVKVRSGPGPTLVDEQDHFKNFVFEFLVSDRFSRDRERVAQHLLRLR